MIYDGDKYFYKDLATRERAVFNKKHALYYENVDNLDYFIWSHFRKALINFDPEIVGVSVYTCKLKAVLNILKVVKEYNPDIKTCVGGAHVTGVPDGFLDNIYVDGVFLGYADVTFPQWIAAGCPRGKMVGRLEDIDLRTIPHVRREALMNPEFYTPRDMGLISTSRGCIGYCTFCSGFMCAHKMKFRTVEMVRFELTEIVDRWKVSNTVVTDASCTDFPEYFKLIADIYKEFDISWETEGRWATITKELLEYFLSHGCDYFNVGLESGSNRMLKYTRKGCTKKMIREKSKILNSIGIKWKLCCIVGFPEETLDDMKETLELAIEIDPSNISLNSFCPLPGTDVYKSIPGITPELASTVSQVYPNHCFSRHMDISTYQNMFLKMTEIFDVHNKKTKGGLRDGDALVQKGFEKCS
jgi:radical SAM superfamily enzyme YgiQ (UPF0313 family)